MVSSHLDVDLAHSDERPKLQGPKAVRAEIATVTLMGLPMTTPSAVAVYARISLDHAGNGLGVIGQLEDCLDEAARRGWKVAGEYVYNDVSTYSSKTRPQYR